MKKNLTITIAAALTVLLTACGNSSTSYTPDYVGMDAAKSTALSDAGVGMNTAVFSTAKLEQQDGTAYYQLKFSDGTTDYDYDVDALTGVIIESKKESLSAASDQPSAINVAVAINETQAKEIALADAGVAENDTSYLVVKPDIENGVAVYDVEFYVPTTNLEYDYEIDAQSGAIRSKDQDIEGYTPNNSATTGSTTSIGEVKAKEIALTDAGVMESDASYLVVKQDMDNGVLVYDVEFYVPATNLEYDYEIDAATGSIRSKDQDIEGYAAPNTNTAPAATPAPAANSTVSNATTNTTTTAIDENKAKEIALSNAGVAESSTSYLVVKQDYEHGVPVFEVEFYANGTEYDYEIDATTGNIRSVDHDAEGYTAPQTGSAKSEAEIQSIALAKVPGATAQNLRMHMDYDDGRQTYEGTIVYNSMEYEFTIDAYSGAILEWESESIYD